MSTALVRLERVRFGGGRRWPEPDAVLAVPPLPRNTLDPRYSFCLEHHLACVCREAEHAEQRSELHMELESVRTAARQVLAGHRLFDHGDGTDLDPDAWFARCLGDGPLACQCSGCRLIRAADIGGLLHHALPDGVLRGAS